jgi:hypothetical protein
MTPSEEHGTGHGSRTAAFRLPGSLRMPGKAAAA